MFFRRNEGQYRETDRVTRFKLVKSGKHWLRAATSNFGLFKVLRGGVDTPSVAAHQVEVDAPAFSGQTLLKGVLATGALLGGSVVTQVAHADEMTDQPILESEAGEIIIRYFKYMYEHFPDELSYQFTNFPLKTFFYKKQTY